MAYQTLVILPSAARTTSGNAATAVDDTGDTVSILVSVTAATGTTPTLDISIEWSPDGTIWAQTDTTPDAFAQITTTKNVVKTFPDRAKFYRVVYAIGGTTPSFTFQVQAYETN
jgi:hypothetical protein